MVINSWTAGGEAFCKCKGKDNRKGADSGDTNQTQGEEHNGKTTCSEVKAPQNILGFPEIVASELLERVYWVEVKELFLLPYKEVWKHQHGNNGSKKIEDGNRTRISEDGGNGGDRESAGKEVAPKSSGNLRRLSYMRGYDST